MGGIGVKVVLGPGRRVGGAGSVLGPLETESGAGPKLWDLELVGGGPGGGGGRGIAGSQPACEGEGEYSIGVLELSPARATAPAEAARRAVGGLMGDSGLYRRSGNALDRNLRVGQ